MADPYAEFSSPAASATPDPYAAFSSPAGAQPGRGTAVMRVLGQGAQGFNDAIADTAGAPVDAVSWALRKVGVDAGPQPFGGSSSIKKGLDYVATLPGRVGDAVSRGSTAPLTEDRTSRFEPQTIAEKTARGIGEGAGNALAIAMPAGVIARGAKVADTLGPRVANVLAQQPVAQTAIGAAGGGVGGATDSPGAALATTLAIPTGAAVLRGAGTAAVNALAPGVRNVEGQAAKILGRALDRDNTNFNALAATHENYPAGTPLAATAGENVRGAVRGSIAAPGPARTTVGDAADTYLTGADKRTSDAIARNVSDAPPISTRINALDTERSAAAAPAYQAAGIPDRIQMTETTRPGEPVTREVPILPGAIAKTKITEPGPPVTDRAFNTPNVSSPAIDALLKDSADMRAAIGAARRLPEFKNLPSNSMAMLDKAYKHLNGMEQEAVRSGNGTRAHDLSHLRTDLKTALVEANPAYGKALDAYAGPSQLIDAAETGRSWFSKNIQPEQVAREFQGMPPAQQKEAVGGAADYLRTKAANTDRATAAERIWNNQNVRDRLKAILPADQYEQFATLMEQDKTGAKAIRGITQGSRTVPMGLEAADNAGVGNALVKALQGRFGSALLDAGSTIAGRVGEGRTQAVNNTLANWLMETDPQKVGLVRSLAERARLQQTARSTGRAALIGGGAASNALHLTTGQ